VVNSQVSMTGLIVSFTWQTISFLNVIAPQT